MGLPNARSVCRVAGNGRAVMVYFDDPLSSEQMRELHCTINRDMPRPPCTEHDWTCTESGMAGLLLWTCRHCNYAKLLSGSMRSPAVRQLDNSETNGSNAKPQHDATPRTNHAADISKPAPRRTPATARRH